MSAARRMTVALPAAACLAAAVAVLLLSACPALAGSYTVSACSPATSPGAWAQVNTFPAAFQTANGCGGPEIGPTDASDQGALLAQDILNSPANIPDGAAAGWTFTAPAGATITAIRYYRSLAAYNESDLVAGLYDAAGNALEQCMIAYPFPPGSSIRCSKPNEQAPITFSGLSTSSLFFGVRCRIVDNSSACIAGGAPLHAARADLYSARVTLSESTPPVVGAVGGGAWGGGVISGSSAVVTFAATDASGIRGAVVRGEGGQTLGSLTQACDDTLVVPCAQLPAGAIGVDTTRVADGPHTLQLVVGDSAQNTASVSSPVVVVDNHGPPAPVGLTAAAAAGSTAIAVRWRNPATVVAVAGAMAQLCAGAVCASPAAIDAAGAGTLTAPGPGSYVVRVWLLDSAGKGGPGRAATAPVTITSTSGSSSTLRAVISGARLRVSGTLRVTGRVRVSWRSKRRGRSVAAGSRVVALRARRLGVTFRLARRARVSGAVTRVVVRARGRVVAHARARRG